jgi:hypothetical protein
MNPRSRIGVDDDVSGYRTLRRTLAVAACGALAATATACNDDPVPLPLPKPSLSAPASASAAPALAAVPECAQVQRLVDQVLPGVGDLTETPYSGDETHTVQDQCVFGATLAGGGPELVVTVRYGRFADGIDGRSAAASATRPMTDEVMKTCTGSARKLGAALVCTNKTGQLRSGAGLVGGGDFATTDIFGDDGETVTTQQRTVIEAAARDIARKTFDELT